mmetsp:Transcript_10316/g.17940  ORF Transcript_10316/g.17940 Transcript_10316/m.17940 type:complete len:222 (+) Transcript_10316:108-773(+)
MGDLVARHGQAKKLILMMREGLEKLEGMESGMRPGDPAAQARELGGQLVHLQRMSQDLEGVWRMFAMRENAAKRALWKGKVDAVVEEVGALQRTLGRYGGREAQRAVETSEREELLARAEQGRQVKGQMDLERQMAGSVANSKRALEEIYQSGASVLGGMATNRERLKAAQRKMLDVLNSVGLGDTLLKLIERRQRMDIWVAYGGMVLILLVVGLLMWYLW